MKFISVQPAEDYYVWQHEVFDHSLKTNGYDLNDSIVIFTFEKSSVSKAVRSYARKNRNRVFLIEDTRRDKSYTPSLRPHAIKKLCKEMPELANSNFWFYHDADIALTKYTDWDAIATPEYSCISDTRCYIGAEYIESKSPELLVRMAGIVGIEPKIVKDNQNNSGGAQYILPPAIMTPEFWDKVERDCTDLNTLMKNTEDIYCPKHPIQRWCSDMWAVLWNLWLEGIETKLHPAMNFAWPAWQDCQWKDVGIYHNAGVSNDLNGEFFKPKYTHRMPFGDDFTTIKKGTCNTKYVEIIEELADLKTFYNV